MWALTLRFRYILCSFALLYAGFSSGCADRVVMNEYALISTQTPAFYAMNDMYSYGYVRGSHGSVQLAIQDAIEQAYLSGKIPTKHGAILRDVVIDFIINPNSMGSVTRYEVTGELMLPRNF